MGSSSGNNYSVQKTGPWDPQQDYLHSAFRTASQLFGIAPSSGRYPGYNKFSPYSVAPNFAVEDQAAKDQRQKQAVDYYNYRQYADQSDWGGIGGILGGLAAPFTGGTSLAGGFLTANGGPNYVPNPYRPATEGIYGTGGGYSTPVYPQIGGQLPQSQAPSGSASVIPKGGGMAPAPEGGGDRYKALARFAASQGNPLAAAAYARKAKGSATAAPASSVPAGARDVTPPGGPQMSGGLQMAPNAYSDWFSAQQSPAMGGGLDIGYDGGYQFQPGLNLPPNAPVVMDLLANAPRYYPGDTVADFNPAQTLGLELGAQRALAGSDLNRSAQSGLEATLRGDYMDPTLNPGLSQAADQIAGRVAREAALYGRTGSGAHLDTLGKNLTNLYGQNYEAERNRQMGGYQLAPGLSASDYTDFDRLFGYGQQGQEQAQNEINADFERYKYTQELPYRQLANFMNMISGNYGSSGMSLGQQTQTPSMMQQLGQGLQLGTGGAGLAMLPFLL